MDVRVYTKGSFIKIRKISMGNKYDVVFENSNKINHYFLHSIKNNMYLYLIKRNHIEILYIYAKEIFKVFSLVRF